MPKLYSLAFKQRMLERMVGKDATSANKLAGEVGVASDTLSRWRREALSLPVMTRDKSPRTKWSLEDKIRLLADASKVAGKDLPAFLEKEGVLLAELEQWREALDERGGTTAATTKRIRALERELARKEKALAEAAALLVLKKKLQFLDQDDEDSDDPGDSEK